jgi:NitT/TauT family transport system substrate-binding protein
MHARCPRAAGVAVACLATVLAQMAAAQEPPLRVSVSGREAFVSQVPELGRRHGLFEKHGVALDIRYARDGAETLAQVGTGAADVGVSASTLSALGAFAQGAPVRIVGSALIGGHEFWYVPARSPIRAMAGAAGRTVAYSAAGSPGSVMVQAFQELHGIALKPVATGDPAATLAQVMSGKVDVGYSLPPAAIAEIEQGRIRIIARANDLPALAGRSVRVIVANAAALETRADKIRRYLQGYRDTVDWLFSSDPQADRAQAEFAAVPESAVRRARGELITKESVLPDRIAGLDALIADAASFRLINVPLSAAQIETVLRLQAPIK